MTTQEQIAQPVRIQHYGGATHREALQAFAKDATDAAAAGYTSTGQTSEGQTLFVTYQAVSSAGNDSSHDDLMIPAGALTVGGAVVAVGSLLPWISASSGFETVTRSGIEGGDGLVSIALGSPSVYWA